MSEHAFDTLRFAERLEKTGMTREQASEVSKGLGDFMQEKLATKEDLRKVKSELLNDISILQERIIHKLTIRLGTMLVSSIAGLAFLMDWILKGIH